MTFAGIFSALNDNRLKRRMYFSLYPYICKYGSLPVGHPKLITEGFEKVSKDSNPYFGLIKYMP